VQVSFQRSSSGGVVQVCTEKSQGVRQRSSGFKSQKLRRKSVSSRRARETVKGEKGRDPLKFEQV
jgi:hypothetical protein